MSQQEIKSIKPFPPAPIKGVTGVVVLSGGQDSVTCLGVAMKCYEKVVAVCFNYGQKHAVELKSAAAICIKHNIRLFTFNIPVLNELGDSALLASSPGSVNEKHYHKVNLPASFVPNRNALFLTAAHALAQKIGAKYVVTGVSQTDYSGYPDCRLKFIRSLEASLNLGAESNISIITPLISKSKAETFLLAKQAGILDEVLTLSHTCYNGDHEHFHDWGYGCGECPACQLRAKGWEEYQEHYGDDL